MLMNLMSLDMGDTLMSMLDFLKRDPEEDLDDELLDEFDEEFDDLEDEEPKKKPKEKHSLLGRKKHEEEIEAPEDYPEEDSLPRRSSSPFGFNYAASLKAQSDAAYENLKKRTEAAYEEVRQAAGLSVKKVEEAPAVSEAEDDFYDDLDDEDL